MSLVLVILGASSSPEARRGLPTNYWVGPIPINKPTRELPVLGWLIRLEIYSTKKSAGEGKEEGVEGNKEELKEIGKAVWEAMLYVRTKEKKGKDAKS